MCLVLIDFTAPPKPPAVFVRTFGFQVAKSCAIRSNESSFSLIGFKAQFLAVAPFNHRPCLVRRTWSMCGLCMTSQEVMQRIYPSKRARSSSSWTNQKNSGGVLRVRRGVSAWSPCPMLRSLCDPPTPVRLGTPPATPTAMVSLNLHMPMPSPRHNHRCLRAHLEPSLPLCQTCKMVRSWPRPSRSGCPVPTTRPHWR